MPDSLAYYLAYDARSHLFPDWWFPAAGLIVVAIGVVLRKIRFLPNWPPAVSNVAAGLLITFAVAWTSIAAGAILIQHWRLRSALQDGTAQQVEGVVSEFHAGDPAGHGAESWCVAGGAKRWCYSYSSSTISPGYRTIEAEGGAVHEGALVRIADFDGHIARLEIGQPVR